MNDYFKYISAVTTSPDQKSFYIKCDKGEQEWVVVEPYSYELYRKLAVEGFVP